MYDAFHQARKIYNNISEPLNNGRCYQNSPYINYRPENKFNSIAASHCEYAKESIKKHIIKVEKIYKDPYVKIKNIANNSIIEKEAVVFGSVIFTGFGIGLLYYYLTKR